MQLNFTKMHGLGNDFIVIDNLHDQVLLNPEIVRFIADRRMGIGCDQVLVLQTSSSDTVDVMFRFYNADGSEAEQCGNGARCLGKYLVDNEIIDGNVISAETKKGIITIHIDDVDAIRVNMGRPEFEPAKIPFLYNQRMPNYDIELNNEVVRVFCLSMGNPHAVLIVDDIESARVNELGQQLQINPKFPDSVNVGFLQILDRNHVRLRVYERGVGETLACGTGSCAAAVAGILDGKLDHEVVIELKKGNLVINWKGEGSDVWMTGPATTVYHGHIEL
jgi:diaminopimelate epimerase